MRFHHVIMIGLAVVFGGLAVFAGQKYLQRQAALQRPAVVTVVKEPAVALTTVVVAASTLRYGDELTSRSLREVAWPAEAAPKGAFKTVAELLGSGEKRVVLAGMEPNEPVLAPKITGSGQRGTLSNLLEDGMGAVTIQVNEVVGLAGFLLPGDRVDVMLTRQENAGDGGANPAGAFTDIVLQNVRVLAVGQTADERSSKPMVVTAVTVEVGLVGAQKIALASKTGSLSLMLRKAGEVASRPGRRVALGEIGGGEIAGPSSTVTVRVARGSERKDYAVPAHGLAPAAEGAVATRPAAARAAWASGRP